MTSHREIYPHNCESSRTGENEYWKENYHGLWKREQYLEELRSDWQTGWLTDWLTGWLVLGQLSDTCCLPAVMSQWRQSLESGELLPLWLHRKRDFLGILTLSLDCTCKDKRLEISMTSETIRYSSLLSSETQWLFCKDIWGCYAYLAEHSLWLSGGWISNGVAQLWWESTRVSGEVCLVAFNFKYSGVSVAVSGWEGFWSWSHTDCQQQRRMVALCLCEDEL